MTSVGIKSAEQTTDFIYSADTAFQDVTAAAIASGDFVGSKKYLILANFHLHTESSSVLQGARVVRSDTGADIGPAEYVKEPYEEGTFTPTFVFEYTQPATPHGIKLQVKTYTGGTAINCRTSSLIAIPIGDFAAANYASNEDDDTGAPTALTTTAADFASVTFTGSTDVWMAIAVLYTTGNTTSGILKMQFDRTGSASENRVVQVEGEDTAEQPVWAYIWSGTLTAVSNTFKVQASCDVNDDFDHVFSGIYLFNLTELFETVSASRDSANSGNITDDNTWATSTEMRTVSHNPATTGNQVVFGYGVGDMTGASHRAVLGLRFQEGGATFPTGSDASDTLPGYQSFDAGNADQLPACIMAVKSMTTGAKTIDLDATAGLESLLQVADRCLIVFSDESAAAIVDTSAAWGFGRWNQGLAKRHRRQMFLMSGQPFLHSYHVGSEVPPVGVGVQILGGFSQAAVGLMHPTGVGTQTLGIPSQEGVGVQTFPGVGIQVLGIPAQVGVGVMLPSGVGVQSLLNPLQAGVGVQTFPGIGVQILLDFLQAGTGTSFEVFSGIGIQSLLNLSQQGVGVQQFIGVGIQVLGGPSQVGIGVMIPTSIGVQSLLGLSQVGLGLQVFAGTGVQSLLGLLQSGVGVQTFIGVGIQTLLGLSQVGVGLMLPTSVGVQSLLNFLQAGTGLHIILVTGAGVQALLGLSQVGTGLMLPLGVGIQSLLNPRQAGVGVQTFTGTGIQTLLDFSQAGIGVHTEFITSTGVQALLNFLQAGVGAEAFAGIGAQVLFDFTQSATGLMLPSGVGIQTLGIPSQAGVGLETFSGVGTQILGIPTQAGTGALLLTGIGNQALLDFSQVGVGLLLPSGIAAQALEIFSQAGIGTHTLFITSIGAQTLLMFNQAGIALFGEPVVLQAFLRVRALLSGKLTTDQVLSGVPNTGVILSGTPDMREIIK